MFKNSSESILNQLVYKKSIIQEIKGKINSIN